MDATPEEKPVRFSRAVLLEHIRTRYRLDMSDRQDSHLREFLVRARATGDPVGEHKSIQAMKAAADTR